jgi:hypothetical protein
MQKRRRRSGRQNASGTGTRFSSDAALDADAKEGDTFGKLARYETSLERSLFRTLYELRQIQDKRQNRPSPPILDAITLNPESTE